MQNSDSELQSLAARVERLEKQYHWLKSEVVAEKVVTEKLVLVDANEKTRATLGMWEGGPVLTLGDKNEKSLVVLRVSSEGPSLSLHDAKGMKGLELMACGGGPTISLFGEDRMQLLTLQVDELGSKLILFGPDGIGRAALEASSDGPWLNLRDTNGFRAEIGSANLLSETGVTHKTSTASITLSGKDGKVIWSAP